VSTRYCSENAPALALNERPLQRNSYSRLGYLRAHLFGDIFERDNLDWQSRELATVGMLSALPGAEPQLQSHMGISLNVGLSAAQLTQLTQVLADRVDAEYARRAREALTRQLAARASR